MKKEKYRWIEYIDKYILYKSAEKLKITNHKVGTASPKKKRTI